MRGEHHRRADGDQALGDAAERHLDRRRCANRAVHLRRMASPSSLSGSTFPCVFAGHIKRRTVIARARRAADNPGIDERTAGLRDHRGDLLHGVRVHRVAIGVDRFLVGGAQAPAPAAARAARPHPAARSTARYRRSRSPGSLAATMPAALARAALAALRPSSDVSTRTPFSARRLPTRRSHASGCDHRHDRIHHANSFNPAVRTRATSFLPTLPIAREDSRLSHRMASNRKTNFTGRMPCFAF